MTVECEECGEPAVWVISRVVTIENIETGITLIQHPADAYEREMMQDVLCAKCAKEQGYLEVEEDE